MFTLNLTGVSKRFGPRKVFADIGFELRTGESIAITGPNGSGKSTLVKVILSLLVPTKGKVTFLKDGQELDDKGRRQYSAFVSPYLNLYDHLTAEENITFFSTVSGNSVTGKQINYLLSKVGLEGRGPDLVAGYSSGMKQRLKYAVALLDTPAFLFLDEPTSNLDDDGKQIVSGIVDECRGGSIIVIATNETEEYRLAQKQCRVTG